MYKRGLMVALIAILLCSTCACGTEAVSEGEMSETDVTGIGAEDVTIEGAEIPESVENVEQVSSENNEASEGRMEKWLAELAEQGIFLAVWNEGTDKQAIIENGDTYVVQEGDRFFVSTPSIIHTIRGGVLDYFEVQKPEECYFEMLFGGSLFFRDIELEVECSDGEHAKLNFTIGEENSISFDGFDYYFTDGEKYFGFYIPEGYSSYMEELELNMMGSGAYRLSVGLGGEYEQDIYDEIIQTIESTGTDDTNVTKLNYVQKGTYDSIYGEIKLYNVYAVLDYLSEDEDDISYSYEKALLDVQGHLISITYSCDYEIVGNIEEILQQLFEK